MRAVIKYPWLRNGVHENDKKWNAYPTEKSEFQSARDGFPHEDQSVEASIMDWADDITYALHDLEDFIRAGRVPIAFLAKDREELASFLEQALRRVGTKWPDVDLVEVSDSFKAVLSTSFAQFGMHRGTDTDVTGLHEAVSFLIGRYIEGVQFAGSDRPIIVDEGLRAEVERFKQLTWYYVIHDPALATMQLGQMRMVRTLFAGLHGWLEEADDAHEGYRLPVRLRELYALTGIEPGHDWYANAPLRRTRAVADYISSLTEGQAVDLHGRLVGSGVHSVTEPWLAY